MTGAGGNFLGGWLARVEHEPAAGAVVLAGVLARPCRWSRRAAHVVADALMGLAGGFVMVIFFSFWRRASGRRHLGRIQGPAQAITVLASAIGPLLLAECVTRTGSYAAMFYLLALRRDGPRVKRMARHPPVFNAQGCAMTRSAGARLRTQVRAR